MQYRSRLAHDLTGPASVNSKPFPVRRRIAAMVATCGPVFLAKPLRLGNMTAATFENSGQRATFYSVKLERGYKEG